MAARKKSTTRKASVKRGGSAATRIERLTQDLPPTLVEFSKRVQKQLSALEKQIERARTDARRRAARLLRQASHQLGRLEAQGENAFARLGESARKELIRLLRQLENAITPTGNAKKVVRRAKAGVKKAADSASDAASKLLDS
jgi:hypothetical protein